MNFFALKNIIGFLIVITLISGVAIGVRLVQQQTQLKSKAVDTCGDNPVPPPEGGYTWKADCSSVCNSNTDCPIGANNQEGWCYGFEGGAKCLKLVSTGNVGTGAAPVAGQACSAADGCGERNGLYCRGFDGGSYTWISETDAKNFCSSQQRLTAECEGVTKAWCWDTTGTGAAAWHPTPPEEGRQCDKRISCGRAIWLPDQGKKLYCRSFNNQNDFRWIDENTALQRCASKQYQTTQCTPDGRSSPETTAWCWNDGLWRTTTPPAGGPDTPACTVDLKANGSDGPVTVDNNATVTLSWTSQNADRVNATGAWSGSKSTSGSETTDPLSGPSSSTFSLTCFKNNSTQTSVDSVQVNVRGPGGAAPSAQDFSISASAPNPASITAGASASSTSTVTITSLNSFNSAVVLSAVSPRTDITASVNPTSVTPAANGTAATSTLTITTAAATPVGSYTINVTGTSGALTHPVAVPLTVVSTASAPTAGSRCDYDILDINGRSVKTTGPIYENDRYTFRITMTNTGRAGQSGDWTKSNQWLQALENTESAWRIAQRFQLPKDQVSKDTSVVFNIDATAGPISTQDKNFEDRPTSFSMAETGTGPFGATCPTEVRVLRKPAGLVSTKCYVISENRSEVDSVLSCDDPLAKPYTNNPTIRNYTFRDQTPGKKFIFVKFFDVNNRPSNMITKTVTYSPNPAISNVLCAYGGSGLTTVYNITGNGFGLRNVNNRLKVGDQNATILSWGSAEITAQVDQRVEGDTALQVALEDGRKADGSCAVGITTATLSVKNQCLSGQFDTDNVDVKLFSNGPEPFVRQTIKTDKEGKAQGFIPKLEKNKNYTMIVKAPGTLAKGVVFRTTSGTSVIGPIVLPCGNIAPLPVPDNVINSFDVSALFSQWSLVKDVSKPADLNRDGRVNSVDYAFMKLNFNQQDDVFTLPVVASPTPSPSPSPSPSVVPSSFSSADVFRDYILNAYGFTATAADFIKRNSTITVNDLSDSCSGGGGFWIPATRNVQLNCAQHEGTVHELSHVWWHTFRLQNPEMVKGLARDVVRLADGDGSSIAVAFARTYVYGDGGSFKGMYCNNGCVADVHNLQDSDFDLTEAASNAKINDWEIYAGLSSWTVGRFKTGSRALPSYFWKYFEPQFTGTIQITPYYDGGHA
ncbi:hypothetical protein HYS96_02830 [Candidatus Daviesbacteria bacterium]|nr:hypothetical protein [Candidatus Daviesbacteria bacterium]